MAGLNIFIARILVAAGMELNGRASARLSKAPGDIHGTNAKLSQSDISVFDPLGLDKLGRTKLRDFDSPAIAIIFAYIKSAGAPDAIG